jgi:hypothetical protein
LASGEPKVVRPYKIPTPVSLSPKIVPAIAPAAIFILSFSTGIENLTVAKTGVDVPKRNVGITPAPMEKLSVTP